MRELDSKTNVLTGQTKRGVYEPSNAKYNFAVPSKSVIKSASSQIPNEIFPGVLQEVLDNITRSTTFTEKSLKICVDLKRINANKASQMSTVDLWGLEDEPTKQEIFLQLELDISLVSDLRNIIHSFQEEEKHTMNELVDPGTREIMIDRLKDIILILSRRIEQLRRVLKGKEDLSERLKKKAELENAKDWRKSRFAYAISSIKTFMHNVNECISNAIQAVDNLCLYLSSLNKSHDFERGNTAYLDSQQNYACLNGQLEENTSSLRHTRQRSDAWFAARKSAKVSASSLHHSIGLGLLKQQQRHFDEVIMKKLPTLTQSSAMTHGITNEINGCATIVGKILPSLFPHVTSHEVGSYVLETNGYPFVIASPDGEGWVDGKVRYLFEIKCQVKSNSWKYPVFYNIPRYYLPQILCQLGVSKHALGYQVMETIFVSWSDDTTTAFLVKFDERVWLKLLAAARELYGDSDPVRPKKKLEIVPEMQDELLKFSETNVTFLGEFKSLKAAKCEHGNEASDGPYTYHQRNREVDYIASLPEVKRELISIIDILKQEQKLTSPQGTDIIVFMLSDLDRTYDINQPYVFPIAYGISPKNIKTDTVRQMLEYVRFEAKERNLSVNVEAFDGQFSKIATSTRTGHPLTVLEEMKAVWKDMRLASKRDLMSSILGLQEVLSRNASFASLSELVQIEVQQNLHDNNPTFTGPIFVGPIRGQQGPSQETLAKMTDLLTRSTFRKSEETSNIKERQSEKPEQERIDMENMRNSLAQNATVKRQSRWKVMSKCSFQTCFANGESINNSFTKPELHIMLKSLPHSFQEMARKKHLNQSALKGIFINFYLQIFGKEPTFATISSTKTPKSLKQLTRDTIRRVSKETLNALTAEMSLMIISANSRIQSK